MKYLSFFLVVMLIGGFVQGQGYDEASRLWLDPATPHFETIRQQVEQYYAGMDKGRGSGYKQWKRWEEFYQSHLDAQGNIVRNYAKINFDEHFRYVNTSGELYSRSNTGYWTETGPKSYTRIGSGHNGGLGRVNVIAFHPTNSSIIYVGTPAGGLWKTTNGGATWTPLTDGLPRIGISGIAINYLNPDIIYILTGDGDGRDSYSVGVLKTYNGGQTWFSTGLTFDPNSAEAGYKLLMHPTNTAILFAATTDGIYRTVNSGQTWTRVVTGTFNDIEFKPGDPSIMYAMQKSSSSTFYRSTDGGVTWSSSGVSGVPTGCSRIEIGVSPANSAYVYLLCGPATGVGSFKGVYRSFDSGLNFYLRSNTPNILGYSSTGNDDDHQTTYDLAIAVSPVNVSTIITGGINVWRSTNYGVTMNNASQWNESSATEYTHADIHELVYNPLNNYLYCGSDGGIFVSTDHGVNWTDISSGLQIMQFYKIDIDEGDQYDFIGGTQDNGTNYRTVNTTNFSHIEGGDGYDCLIDYNNPSVLYLTANSNLYKSTNGGSSISTINPSGISWFANVIQDPVDPDIIFVGDDGLLARSIDGGNSWSYLNSEGNNAICQGISYRNRFYAASGTSLQRSDNVLAATPTWTTISGNPGLLNTQTITGICVDPNNSLNVFICKGGYVANEKVFESTDGGATWVNLSTGLPNVPVHCIVYHPGSADGIYIGTDIGVFYRDDNLGGWIPFRNGLPTTIVKDLAINSTTSTIYAGTHGRGLWSSPVYSSCPFSYSLTNANLPGAGSSQGYRFYQASDFIWSTRLIDGGIGTSVTYKAGDYILLNPGFEVKSGSEFHAYLGPCSSGIPDSFRVVSGTYAGPMEGVVTAISENQLVDETDYVMVYPNPIDEYVVVEFRLVSTAVVTIELFDLQGKLVSNITKNQEYTPGTYTARFNCTRLPPGNYLCRFSTPELNQTIQITKL